MAIIQKLAGIVDFPTLPTHTLMPLSEKGAFNNYVNQTNNIYHSKLLKISLFSGPSFGDSGRSEFMLKKTLNLTKSKTLDRVDSILRVRFELYSVFSDFLRFPNDE